MNLNMAIAIACHFVIVLRRRQQGRETVYAKIEVTRGVGALDWMKRVGGVHIFEADRARPLGAVGGITAGVGHGVWCRVWCWLLMDADAGGGVNNGTKRRGDLPLS